MTGRTSGDRAALARTPPRRLAGPPPTAPRRRPADHLGPALPRLPGPRPRRDVHGPVRQAAPVGTGGSAVPREEEIMLRRCRRVGCRDWAVVALEPFGPLQ